MADDLVTTPEAVAEASLLEHVAAALILHDHPEANALTRPDDALVMVRTDPKFFVCAAALSRAAAVLAALDSAPRPALGDDEREALTEGQAESVHKPFTDDGVTYCGWDGHEGCGEVWPCSTVRGRQGALLPEVQAAEADRAYKCYRCSRGDHDHCKGIAWRPGIPCGCNHGATLTEADREALARHLRLHPAFPDGPAATEMKEALWSEVESILAARAHQPTPPAQAEAVLLRRQWELDVLTRVVEFRGIRPEAAQWAPDYMHLIAEAMLDSRALTPDQET